MHVGNNKKTAPSTPLVLACKHGLDRLARVRLRALKRCTEGTVPDKLSGDTKGTGDTEQDGVELHLVEAVVGKEDTGVRVHVGPWVLSLAGL